MLEKIKLLLGLNDDKDFLLTILIEQATNEALDFTHRDSAEGLDTSIIQMVVYKYNRLGTEGVDNENYSGVSFSYSADYPESIIRSLKAKRRVLTI